MATSFTSLLGLALPVTGELAGTWGDVVNNSITALLDSAVAGTTTLSTDADVTLTTTTGSSNQSRQAILLCSGARTVLRNITAPAQSKMYVVINSTTGGFSVVIRGVGPTTGVTVAAGKTAVVVWNGSDFVEVAPATATTATNLAGGVAGSLPYQSAASTTTFLGIGAANYVLTSTGTAPTWTLNTGTGSVVRATSPTIDTPTFTTFATFPLHIGGTGTTSTLTLRSTSNVGTTGADIIFQTGNNGATEAMRVLNSGFVGIGTNAPSQKLTIGTGDLQIDNAQYVRGKLVAGTTTRMLGINASNLLYVGSIDAAVSGIIFNVNGTAYAQFDASGNLGIGTASPGTKLEVSGAAKANYAIASGPLAAYASSSGGLYSYFAATAGTLNAVTDNSGTAGTLILATGSERVRITSTGNVGVNTTSPETKLHVTSAASSAGLGTNGILTLQNTNGDTFDRRAEILFKQVTQAITAISSSYTGFAAGPQYAGDLIFATKATTDAAIVERMRITSAGNVGIGTTTIGSPLTVYAGNNQATIKVTNGPSANNVGITLESLGGNVVLNNGNGPFELSTGGSIRAVVTTAGNVGIGLTAPAVKLETLGAGTSIGQGYFGTTGFGAAASSIGASIGSTTLLGGADVPAVFLQRWRGSGTDYVTTYVGHASSDPYNFVICHGAVTTFRGVAAERLRIDGNGNVGIGNASPGSVVPAALVIDQPNSRTGIAIRCTATTGTDNSTEVRMFGYDGAATTVIGQLTAADSAHATLANSVILRANRATGYLRFDTGGANERMRLLSSGQLLLGTSTGSGLAQNYIDINAAANCGINFKATDVTQGYVYADDATDEFRLAATGASNQNALTFYTGGSERARITSAGRFGIGTSAPAQLLHIASGDATALIENTAATSNATLQLKYPSRTWALANRGSDLSGAFAVRDVTAGADRLIITSAGNVGIGSLLSDSILTVASSTPIVKIRDLATAAINVGGTFYFQGYTNGVTGLNNFAIITGAKENATAADGSGYFSVQTSNSVGSSAERMRITSAGNVGIGTTTPVNALQVNGSLGRNAPVTKTTSFTLAATENWLICNGTATITVTLPAASSWTGREVMIKNIAAFTVVSASSNVVPLVGGAAGTAILAATAGAWATLVSDGTNWIIMQA